MNKTIVFTGGGSAGHVTPNIAIISEMNKDWDIHYIGSKKGIEKELIQRLNIPYFGIHSGKLRRYADKENLIDIFRVMKGCFEARSILKKLKPSLVFSKGGFVSVPVILAAKTLKIPIYIHESDKTPGLANKISQRFATKIFTSFDETKHYFPAHKTFAIGSPIRKEIVNGTADKGRKLLGYTNHLPILTIMGGSLGAKRINEVVRESLNQLTANYQIVHICGKNNLDGTITTNSRYIQFEYVQDELPDILAATDIVITRGGSNAIFEFLALHIPMIIIPLGMHQSRGDQILNAKAFEKKGFSLTLEEDRLNQKSLIDSLNSMNKNRSFYREKMKTSFQGDALQILVNEINNIHI
ncbi:undecaprenyldiphospho-muramoylpentapeptide beta-N-acetylglucosaminyltransferase [Cytobacillus solani]|uniref:UDP-N-acetylglucosamine--N-acetylmuramyl-(pentapeptide) pyrophosphoryl-undecaprenol N-acetylglucosamine transferase n=1 Tax=Cytobacillus solani TaxID=1637975 RepID=A0A0Q3QPU9_9BACI|nr:undecaprenyldiphospho-muramoylpentapeptide beta-N-acetylglucosaminyltransferase [Cytobacillus solani]KQL19632.1 UDP-diphospho-muramoylpentapeptide beta-N-acetylglucosaminyltransferase [Cytobacillus solani]USK52862.1 undecaprenyldiphospho-muramoylpentapeptide beta-N-acetylglucosaminyltransferase [Cytobacillus solani]